MTKLYCSCIECGFNEKQRCKAKEVRLNTSNDVGWVCTQYFVSNESQEILDSLQNLTKLVDK